ncbi:MAG: metallophosphoesterase [Bryobacterales bacterium]|nr:metallophosphoesterase [Bryobacterales bacterium]
MNFVNCAKRKFCLWLCAAVLVPVLPVAALDPAPAGSFTIVVLPDTQGYRGRATKAQPDSAEPVTNSVFDAHTRWIVENIDAQRIVFVSHVGDIVDIDTDAQWEVARRAMDRLHGRVPYAISVGNHDMTQKGDSSLFQKYFGAARFAIFSWYGGTFGGHGGDVRISGNNANSYQLFSAEGLDFVFLHLECNAPDDVLEWAGGILRRYASRRAMITTHMDLGPLDQPKTPEGFFKDPKGRMRWVKRHGTRGNSPQQMWEKLYQHHPNLFAVFSGDQSRTVAMNKQDKGRHGNTVHALLSDYTSSGPLRLYRFVPARNVIEVITYDTTRRELVEDTKTVPGRENHQFTIPLDLSRRAK